MSGRSDMVQVFSKAAAEIPLILSERLCPQEVSPVGAYLETVVRTAVVAESGTL